MQTVIRAVALALGLSLSLGGGAFAQGKQVAPAESGAADQIALTEKQVQSFITTAPEINKVMASLQSEPDQKTMAQLDALAKKGGFASYDEYDSVAANIDMVLQGIDPQTKKFGDPKAMIQAQIKQVQADKSMKPTEKKEALAELNDSLKDVQPIKNQGNIPLVEKNYDKLAALMQSEN